jgi:hypothetical protein
MINIQTARKQAQQLGYYVREGSYSGTTDDRIGRFYFGHESDNGFRPYGAGYRTQTEAWNAALEDAALSPTPRGQRLES